MILKFNDYSKNGRLLQNFFNFIRSEIKENQLDSRKTNGSLIRMIKPNLTPKEQIAYVLHDKFLNKCVSLLGPLLYTLVYNFFN